MIPPNEVGRPALPIIYRDTSDSNTFRNAAWGRVFNERRDYSRRPKAVVLASTSEHVKAAVLLANEQNCRVSVRSGGHSWAAWSVRDEAILIDLGDLKGVSYDEETKIVTCTPSSTGRIVNGLLKEKGRMFAGGHCPDVGLGGFLLQGGMGWNCKVRGSATTRGNRGQLMINDTNRIGGGHVRTLRESRSSLPREKNSSAAKPKTRIFSGLQEARVRVGIGFALVSNDHLLTLLLGFPAVITKFHLRTRPLFSLFDSTYIYPVSRYREVLQWVVDVS